MPEQDLEHIQAFAAGTAKQLLEFHFCTVQTFKTVEARSVKLRALEVKQHKITQDTGLTAARFCTGKLCACLPGEQERGRLLRKLSLAFTINTLTARSLLMQWLDRDCWRKTFYLGGVPAVCGDCRSEHPKC